MLELSLQTSFMMLLLPTARYVPATFYFSDNPVISYHSSVFLTCIPTVAIAVQVNS